MQKWLEYQAGNFLDIEKMFKSMESQYNRTYKIWLARGIVGIVWLSTIRL